jgi:hypothetical protein
MSVQFHAAVFAMRVGRFFLDRSFPTEETTAPALWLLERGGDRIT